MADSPVTVPTDADPLAFVDAVPHAVRRRDAHTLLELFGRVTGERPVMWGPSIVGFGSYHYRYASGREGDAPAAGFSPRSTATTLYFPYGFDGYDDELAALGPHRLGASCLYVKDLATVDLAVLESLVSRAYAQVTSS
ncbi:DUF1801 domain-containing protein [Cellulomonas palmilytica]|uniref:DUF1801 domain-containing protein n=1 Tax=Cellulomonas palmilytica TaxID=2608402 RepID=UPI001F3A3FFA|nr:DUF1801 domain-containing protein [Cellulomonas palmilytica]UJP39175.1 DUF1801 domain-containing protein [Cellulomonas palmilytica]